MLDFLSMLALYSIDGETIFTCEKHIIYLQLKSDYRREVYSTECQRFQSNLKVKLLVRPLTHRNADRTRITFDKEILHNSVPYPLMSQRRIKKACRTLCIYIYERECVRTYCICCTWMMRQVQLCTSIHILI